MAQDNLFSFQPNNVNDAQQGLLSAFNPSDAYSQNLRQPVQGDMTLGNLVSYFMPISRNVMPYEDSPRLGAGDYNFDFPQVMKDAYSGINKFGQAFRGELSPEQLKQLAFDTSLNVAGGGLLTSKAIPNAVPEGALGIFAGKSARTFPVVNEITNKKGQILNDQNRLMGEYQNISRELTKGRMELGDELTDDLVKRKSLLADQMQDNTLQVGKLEDDVIGLLDKRLADEGEISFFRQTDNEFGKGLFKLPDNQFRFEIDDRPAKIKLNIADDSQALFNNITGDALERVLPRTEVGVTKRLSDFLDHDELFKAYPQLKDYPVKIKFDTKDGARGSFNRGNKNITINLADMRPMMEGSATTGKKLKQDIKSTLMHEIQHAIQEIEGFARGSNPDVSNSYEAVAQVIKQRKDIISKNKKGYNAYNSAREDLINLGGAERIKYYEQKALQDSHQPRLLFNQNNWYKYGGDISREVSQELGYAYKKRKSPEREKWISRAFEKLAEKERAEMPVSSRLADTLTMKEIKSQYGKANRITSKNYKSFADYRNANTSLREIENSYRYASSNPQRDFNIYNDSLGEVEARAVQARVEPAENNRFMRSSYPPDQFQQGSMERPPPFGLKNTLRQQGGFFQD